MDFTADMWEQVLHKLKDDYDVTDVAIKTWLKPLKVLSVEDDLISMQVTDDPMIVNILNKKYTKMLKVTIAELTGKSYDLKYLLPDQAKARNMNIQKKKAEQGQGDRSNLNPNFTFDSFVVGNNNKFAHSASLAVAEAPGNIYNPLFIYGGVGLGKTHLMQSVAHYILDENPDMKVLYVTSEDFTNEVIKGIRKGTMDKFRDKYRKVDVLLIDDIQFIIGKESTQEEFFHTFNTLHNEKKQIVVTSDRSPKEMTTLEDRIRSRFEQGLLADIGSPDYETRMAILQKKVAEDDLNIDDEILNYIAINFKSNIREIEGALHKLKAFENLYQEPITMESAVRELKKLVSPDAKIEITPQLIMEVVSEHFGISIDQLMSKSRSNDIAKPRQIVMYLCKNMTDQSLESIGNLLGGKDHSTVHHGIERVKKYYKEDSAFRQTVETIQKKINPDQ